ncbi:hypothetical protein RB653_003948 [Dictyostelium firmibasis]|uniref:RCC1-like domain-containing protein n=1 Tax=Dictyostelium firmibasis TaxID=79012 RepID=A0AAN7Z2Y3_9MYCE
MIKTITNPFFLNKNKNFINYGFNKNINICKQYTTTTTTTTGNDDKSKHVLFSFGSFDNLKLGVPGNQDKLTPTQITHLPPFLKIKQFGSSWLNSFLLTDEQNELDPSISNKVLMWGTNKSGNMSLPSEQYRFPVSLDLLRNTFVEKVVGGRSFSLVLTREGKVLGFGENNFGQLGLGDTRNRTTPTPIETLNNQNIIDIGVGLDHSMAVTKAGHVFGWGYNVEGQIGQKVVEYTRMASTTETIDGEEEHQSLREQMVPDVEYTQPTLVPGLEQIKISKVFCGYDTSFLLSARGNVYSFGSNEIGTLGLGSELKGRVTKPTKVKLPDNNEKIRMLSSGASHTLFLTNGGNVYSCGWGTEGRLGLGMDTSNRDSPTLVKWFAENNIKIVKVAAGGSHSIALDNQGRVYSWGNGSNGKLGHGNESDENLPKQIHFFDGSNAVDIFAGIDNSLVLIKE